MIIGNYIYSPIEQGKGYTCGFVKLNFTPRKVEPRVPDASQTGEGQPATGLDALSPVRETSPCRNGTIFSRIWRSTGSSLMKSGFLPTGPSARYRGRF